MAVIQVTPALLQAKATEVRGLKSNHDDTMAKLSNIIHSLNEHFKGGAHDAFVAKFDSMQPQFKNFSEMLEDYAKLMDKVAIEMQEKDIELKDMINFS